MITFNFQEVLLKLQQRQLLRKWLTETIIEAGYKPGDVNYIFCNDDFLLDINRKYLKHNTLTDIVTFDYSERKILSGDIYISIERVAENARKFSNTFAEELHRVMVHGILHLTGQKDKTEIEKSEMRNSENRCLEKLNESLS
ncbi:MAG TPA: rRNA maturation RNase YbeY [Bacteroidales bacterium]|nr:rRNA maturation RNase YbeY [Bacteroidales bacterium]